MSDWFNNGLMQPGGENGILFTSEYCHLKLKKNPKKYKELKNLAWEAIQYSEETFAPNGDPLTYRSPDKREKWSHDNHTGLLCLGHTFKIKVNYFPKNWYKERVHPRDLVFYAYLKGGIFAFIAWFFLWIPSISMIISCLEMYKKNEFGDKIIKTDGKILAWLRFNTVNMPLTELLCDLIIERRLGSWGKVFEIYFGKEHPNTKLAYQVEHNDR